MKVQLLLHFLIFYLPYTLVHSISHAAQNGKLEQVKIKKEIFEDDDNTNKFFFNMRKELNLTSLPAKNVDIRLSRSERPKSSLAPRTIESLIQISQTDSIIRLVGPIDREELCPDQQLIWLEKMHEDKTILKSELEPCEQTALFYVTYKSPRKRKRQEVLVYLQLNIMDVNDNLPKFMDEDHTLSIRENTRIGRTYKLPSANDPDLPPNNIARYTFAKNTPKLVRRNFEIGGTPNKVDGSIIPHLKIKQELDREAKKGQFYEFSLVAEDGNPEQPLRGQIMIKIKILDENDNPPEFLEPNPVVDIPEDTLAGQVIKVLLAKDADLNNKISYHMASNTKSQDRKIFKVNQTTGEVSVRKDIASLNLRKNVRHIHITAQDDGDPAQEQTIILTVRIQPSNNKVPEIKIQFLDNILGTNENKEEGEHIAVVTAEDPDGNGVECKLKRSADDDSKNFILQETAFQQAKSVAVYSLRPSPRLAFDRETKDTYKVTIVAIDDGSPPQQTEKQFTINILDLNDHSPNFLKKTRTIKIKESRGEGKLEGLTIRATDLDIDINAKIKYSFDDNGSIHYTNSTRKKINKADLPIHLDENTGDLILVKRIDAELIRKIVITVTASDPDFSDSQVLVFEIQDVNEFAPKFTKPHYNFTIDESDEVTLDAIGRVRAVDLDRDGNVTYEIVKKSEELPFFMNEKGEIRATKPLDREEKSSYTFQVRALDSNRRINRGLIGTAKVTVRVLDINDNPPILCPQKLLGSGEIDCPTDSNKVTIIQANRQVNETVVIIEAEDYDADFNSQLEYLVVSQRRRWADPDDEDVALFAFRKGLNNPDKSALVVLRSLNEGDVGPYVVGIQVGDAGIPPKKIEAQVKVYINSIKTPLNRTSAGLTFINRPDAFTMFVGRVETNLKQFNNYLENQGIDGVAQILIAATVVALLVLFCIACIYIARNQCNCCNCCCCCCTDDDDDEKLNTKEGENMLSPQSRYNDDTYGGGGTSQYGNSLLKNGRTPQQNIQSPQQYSAKVVEHPFEERNDSSPYDHNSQHNFLAPEMSSHTPLLQGHNMGQHYVLNGGNNGGEVGTFGKHHNNSSDNEPFQLPTVNDYNNRATNRYHNSQDNGISPQSSHNNRNNNNHSISPQSLNNQQHTPQTNSTAIPPSNQQQHFNEMYNVNTPMDHNTAPHSTQFPRFFHHNDPHENNNNSNNNTLDQTMNTLDRLMNANDSDSLPPPPPQNTDNHQPGLTTNDSFNQHTTFGIGRDDVFESTMNTAHLGLNGLD